MYFHSHFSDEYDQNIDTAFKHMKIFIHWMHENNLFIKDSIIYVNIDVGRKKYICENSIWLLYVLEFTYILIIDVCINDPGHSRTIIYGIHEYEKTHINKNVS